MMLTRVALPSGETIPGDDGAPIEKHVAVDTRGFLQLSHETTGFDPAEQIQKSAIYLWDTDLLQWVRATTLGGGGSTAGAVILTRRHDISATTIYVGEAAPGTMEAAPSWRIKRVSLDVNGNPTSTTYAALGAATQVWDNRASLSYS